MREHNIADHQAVRRLLSEAIEYFQPDTEVGQRTRNRVKYEILRLQAHEGATEEQIMWDLGFEPDSDFWAQRHPEQAQEPRYTYRGKGDYGATSRASFKRLKNEALEDLFWRLGELEKRAQSDPSLNPK